MPVARTASKPQLFASYDSAPASTSASAVSQFLSGHKYDQDSIPRFFDVVQVSRMLVPLLLASAPYSRRQERNPFCPARQDDDRGSGVENQHDLQDRKRSPVASAAIPVGRFSGPALWGAVVHFA